MQLRILPESFSPARMKPNDAFCVNSARRRALAADAQSLRTLRNCARRLEDHYAQNTAIMYFVTGVAHALASTYAQ